MGCKTKQADEWLYIATEDRKPPLYSVPRRFMFVLFSFMISIFVIFVICRWYSAADIEIIVRERRDENIVEGPACSGVPNVNKFDCDPIGNLTKQQCLDRGCCYQAMYDNRTVKNKGFPPLGVPYCYYPADYNGYFIQTVSQDGRYTRAQLKRVTPSGFPKDVNNLNLVITFLDDYSLRIKITDPASERYEVPIDLNDGLKDLNSPLYNVHLDFKTGKLAVSRKSNGRILFNTSLSQMVYADQFLQLSSYLPSKYFYGIGEHYDKFQRNINWQRITLLNSDRAPVPGEALYGSHPFYLSLEPDGNANGVFLFNSNPMDVILQPSPAVTFRPIGGILDFFIMLGPSPADTVRQYSNLIGRTFMPPYWSLGFHLCRFGYNSVNNTRDTLQRNLDVSIPVDVQWNDIDYMNGRRDFTYDPEKFAGLPEFVDDLHAKGMHYVIMTDPGISDGEKSGTYPPYDEGVRDDIFIKSSNGSILKGKVWNTGNTVYPDFSHPNSTAYWTRQFQYFHKEVDFDGVWIDMNEPSNFVDGSIEGCEQSSYEDPPYLPNGQKLRLKTVCMTAKHANTIHYNHHNLYGYMEAAATNKALLSVRGKRPFIITRASFAAQGKQSGHWSGDISSSWEDMRYTIPSLLNFNMYGVPMIGSDICGFNGNTTADLCARWQALGAFYPFSRNHNTDDAFDQDPAALGETVIAATRNALQLRYRMLPYLYTLFYRSHVFGDTVIRPLFFEFPGDVSTYGIDEQFLWGSSLMVMPALYPNMDKIEPYFPKGLWYDAGGHPIHSNGQKIALPANMTLINVALRAGIIVPGQLAAQTTTASRKNPFMLMVPLDENKQANGELYWDDGESLDTYQNGAYNLLQFEASKNHLKSKVITHGYKDEQMMLGAVSIAGVESLPHNVTINGIPCVGGYEQNNVTDTTNFFLNTHSLNMTFPVNEICVYVYIQGLGISITPAGFSLLNDLEITWE